MVRATFHLEGYAVQDERNGAPSVSGSVPPSSPPLQLTSNSPRKRIYGSALTEPALASQGRTGWSVQAQQSV